MSLKNLDTDLVNGIVSDMGYDQLDDDYEHALMYEFDKVGIVFKGDMKCQH